ncbi:hypothetical protein CBOM_05613 [Ceraceosorus bombacis]|uniref:Uncharacterized protein n=1 Tax=Ceraceosorus bombacis TaxID=401625 RepID=A0A0P1BSC0_9BASI|nr:hypothetical protein CBOM_05613 [Ceraceosorus bombacis]
MSAQEVAAGNPLSLALTSPASSPLRERSHSALLDAPADHSPTRRLSDSAAIVGAATSPTTPSAATLPRNHSKAGSEELRRWAAEAMAQRPNIAHPNPLIDTSSTNEAASTSDPLVIKPSASRPESPALGGRWHGSSEIGGATRPLSMHVDSVTSSHDDARPTSYQFPDPRPPSSTTSSTAMVSNASHVDESLGFTRTSSLGRRSQWVLPRDESAVVLQVDETGRRASSPHIDPPKTSGGRRTAYVDVPVSNGRDGTRRSPLAPILTAGRPREPATQQAQSVSHEVSANRLALASHAQPSSRLRPDSPIAEAPQSDDEDPPLGTPVDGYLANAMSTSSVRRGSVRPGDTPPSDTLSDLPAARSGINFGVGAIGASAEAAGPLSQLGLRRGSASDAAGKPSLRLVPSLKREAVATPHAGHEAPQLSHSTLVSLGEVEGISPPIPLSALSATGPSLPIGSTSIDAISVVSQGLEMGLGVHMAAAALNTCLPGASTGFASLAEPRFARMSVASSGIGMPSAATVAASALPSEMSSMGLSFKVTDAQVSAADTLTGLRDSRRGPKSDHASIANGSSEDKPLSKIAEADLGRRRTTGNLGARTRGGPANHPNVTFSVDTLPHRRAGTLDHTSASASSRQMPDMYAYAGGSPALGGTTLYGTNSKGSATHPSIPENDAVYLPFGAVYSSQSSSHSTSGHAGLTSAQDSTQADTPSLGQKAILSPDANSRGSYLGDTSVAGQARESGQDPTGPRLNAPIGAAALANSIGGGGHFGPQVREKLMEVLQTIVGQVPLSGEDGETIHIAEYGSLNSRSAPLLRDVISMFAQRAYESLAYRASAQGASHHSTLSSQSSRLADDGSYFGGVDVAQLGAPTVVAESIDLQPSTLAFSITHEDASSDFRTLAQVLESGESYLDNAWQASHRPPLQNSIFNAYVARSFASRVAPPKTMHMVRTMRWTVIHTGQSLTRLLLLAS